MNKKTEKRKQQDDLGKNYDLPQVSGRTRGRYAAPYKRGTNLVFLSPGVAEHFPDQRAVNTASRGLIRLAKSDSAKRNSTPA